jgi:shikimate dehydrogenase
MKLSGHTTPYAVLGHPIGHSLSPVMHNAAFRELGLGAVYLAFDVHPDSLLRVLAAMGDMGFKGVNLTVPLKEVAFAGLGDLDASAERVGAVNTVEYLPDGTMRGHNTDGKGFLLALAEAFGADVAGRNTFILGSGGAGRALAITCAAAGAGQVSVTDIDADRTDRVAAEIEGLFPDIPVRTVGPAQTDWIAASRDAELVIQCTPVGMKPTDASLLPPEAFRDGQLAFDLVYMYPETAFMRAACTGGARAANGLGMLLHQGAWAFTIWTGKEAAVDAMRLALEQEVYSREV